MKCRMSTITVLALAALVVEVTAERTTVALTKADQLQHLLGRELGAEAAGVFAALERELLVGRHRGEASGRGGARDVDIHPHMAQRKEKAMALAQSIEKGGVDAAHKEVAQLLLNGTSVAAAGAGREAVQANVTSMEQSTHQGTKCDEVHKKFLKQKERLLAQVQKVERTQKKPARFGRKRQPGLITLGRTGRAFLRLTSAEEKAKQMDPEGSCGIAAADHEDLKEALQKVHPCWPTVQQAARKQEEAVSEEEKQEAFVELTNLMLSCKEPSKAELEAGKAAIKAKGGEPEEVAKAGALEMQKKATEVSKLESELLDDEEEDEDADDEEGEEDDEDGAETSLSLLEEGIGSRGSAEAAVRRAQGSIASEGASSAFAAANSELLGRVQSQVDAAIGRLGQLLDSGDEQEAQLLARGLLVGDSTRGDADLVLLILGGIFYAFVFLMCGGPLVLWFLFGWIVCILYKALWLVVKAGKRLLQFSKAVTSSNSTGDASFWGCYAGGLELLSTGNSHTGSGGCFLLLTR